MGLNSEKFAGSSTLSHTVTFGCPAHFDEARLRLNSASSVTEDFTITLDSVDGSSHDVLMYKQNMASAQDIIATGTEETRFEAGDAIIFDWANTDSITYGLEVRYIQ